VIGVLPEQAGIYGRLTAREAVRYAGRLYGVQPEVLEGRVEAILETLEMAPHIDRITDTLSRGMKQKVNIARALVHDPPVVFLDEPTSGLDVISARSVREFVRRFKRDGRCVILSTHIIEEAERLCDRVAIIAGGAVYAKEMLESLRDRRTLLVMILLPALVVPLATLGIPYLEQRQQRVLQTATPAVAIVGQDDGLLRLARATRLIRPVRAPDPLRALRERRVLAVVRLPSGVEAVVARDGQVRVGIQYDASDAESTAARGNVLD